MIGIDGLDGRYSWMRLAVTLAIAAVGNVGMWSIIVILSAVQAQWRPTLNDRHHCRLESRDQCRAP